MSNYASSRAAAAAGSGILDIDRRHWRRRAAACAALALGWVSIAPAPVAMAATDPGWAAYIDTYDLTPGTTHPNALALTAPTGSGTLMRISDGSAISGVQVAGSTAGTVTKSGNLVDPFASGTDAAVIFGGIVDAGGQIQVAPGSSATLTFTGLDPNRTYTLATTANRDRPAGTGFAARTTTFGLAGAEDFTNASSAGTTPNAGGDQVTFLTHDNTAAGYVARWTGIVPGTDGEIVLSSLVDPTATENSFGAAAVMLQQETEPDTTAPVITLVGDAVVTVEGGDSYSDAGATAADDVDGDLTDQIVVGNPVDTSVVGSYQVSYDVADAAGNDAVQVTRTVNVVDTTAPVITLLGDAVVTVEPVEPGDSYTDAGATASDNVDGDLTGQIVVGGDVVDTSVVGTYLITYDVADAAGNHAVQVTRTVNVETGTIVNSTLPSITGDVLIGATLTTDGGTWSPGAVDLDYQWHRGDIPITGATSSTYLVQAADKGKALHVEVTASKSGYTSLTKESAATAAVPGLASLTRIVTPKIQGARRVGVVLTAFTDVWQPQPVEYRFQWYRGTTKITNATGSTYTLVAKDKGRRIKVKVTGSKVGYASATRTSARTRLIAAGILSPTPKPVISGTAVVGGSLGVDAGTWGPTGVKLGFRWLRNGDPIKGATGQTYLLKAADKGKRITVKVTGSLAGYAKKSRTSEATARVAAAI